MEKNVSFTGLLNSLRTEGFCNEMCESCQEAMRTAADELERLLQDYALLSGKYDEVRDRCNLAEKQLFFMENLVRCGDCKYWHEVDDVDGTTFGECKRPHPIIRKHIFLNSGWYCADGERKDGEHE